MAYPVIRPVGHRGLQTVQVALTGQDGLLEFGGHVARRQVRRRERRPAEAPVDVMEGWAAAIVAAAREGTAVRVVAEDVVDLGVGGAEDVDFGGGEGGEEEAAAERVEVQEEVLQGWRRGKQESESGSAGEGASVGTWYCHGW